MSLRSAEGGTTSERRGAGHRVHFEALVAVGEGEAGFEAESLDVSTEGMRLRTAYLPEVGDKLICRFDAGGTELLASGEVIWREPQPRGGEFGLRFLAVDDATAEGLRAMCAPPETMRGEVEAAPEGTLKGARVRLHIEGLGSPMKARVRETASGEILVGSNLEFLRVGRGLELEDVDRGSKREAFIDHVRVEVDPVSNVPQLVVALRCEEPDRKRAGRTTLAFGAGAQAPASEPSPRAPAPSALVKPAAPEPQRAAPIFAGAAASRTPAPVDADDIGDDEDGDLDDQEHAAALEASRSSRAQAAAGASDALDEADADESDAVPSASRLGGAGRRAAQVGRDVAGKIGPVLSGVGLRAKGAVAMAMMAVQRRRAQRDEGKKAAAPRRTTAPAPGGALKSEGRRLVRDDDREDEAPAVAPRSKHKAAAIGSMLGLVAVIAVFALTRAVGSRGAPTAAVDAAGAPPALAAATAPPSAEGNGPVMANVPLFGATPLSTTEAVPSIPDPVASGAPAAGAPAGNDPAAGEEEPGLDDEGPATKEWGQGSVRSPVVLRIKMDGEIQRLDGASGAMGFTVSLPGRRSVSSSASELAQKDKRLASVNVVNTAHGAEVTVQFKDGVPAYMARAKGDRLEIALGTEKKGGAKKVAKAHAEGSKKKAPAKKSDKTDAKNVKKKPAKKK